MSREYTNLIHTALNDGQLTHEQLLESLLKHLSEDQVKDFTLNGDGNELSYELSRIAFFNGGFDEHKELESVYEYACSAFGWDE